MARIPVTRFICILSWLLCHATFALAQITSPQLQAIIGNSSNQFQLPTVITLSGSQGGGAAQSGILAQQVFSGATSATLVPINTFSVSAPVSAPNAVVAEFESNISVGSSSTIAQITSFYGTIHQNSGTNAKIGGLGQVFFVPYQAFVSPSHSEGGTGTGLGQSFGSVIGYDAETSLATGATNFYSLEGFELGVATQTGSSLSHRVGLQIYSGGAAVQGALTDAGIDMGAAASDVRFQCGVCFGKIDSHWPISSTGTIFGTYAVASGSKTAAYGMDFSAVTFSSGFLKSAGFLVDASGNTQTPTINNNAASNTTGIATGSTSGNVTLGGGANNVVIASSIQTPMRVITASGAVTISATSDYFICINKTVGAATVVNLPASPATGLTYLIKDCKGDSSTNNITITPASGTIDGSTTSIIAVNHGSEAVTYDGTQWEVN